VSDEPTTSKPTSGLATRTESEIGRVARAIRELSGEGAETSSKTTITDSGWLAATGGGLTRVGHYQLTREIDAGGMGFVYEAIQDQPRRTVAVKLMRHSLSSRAAVRRFENEAQVLARLRHPGIAQIFEAGTHQHAALAIPYFAMEFIPGARPITTYASARKLTLRQRLELFIEVSDAVHHAHQKGILHRDLKPQNILVDQNGRVKVIDFGIARAVDADQVAATLQTSPDQLLGTLQYMAPEQLDGDPRELDARADVYALGVVLYELVCGKLPYEVSASRLPDASRIIREQEPLRPRSANAAIDPDLETVLLTALHKDRIRRYPSAREMADDLRNVLANEPIRARRDSATYIVRTRIGASARRHRIAAALFAISTAIVASQVIGGRADERFGITRWFERFVVGRFSPDPGPTLKDVRIICFHDLAEIAAIAQTRLSSAEDKTWMRPGRAAILNKLKEASARAVVLDSHAPSPATDPAFDQQLIRAAQSLRERGVDVVFGVKTWELQSNNSPKLAPDLLPYFRWGVTTATMKPSEVWCVPLALQHEGTDALPSLSLQAFASARRPRSGASFEIQGIQHFLEVHYTPGFTADPALPASDRVNVTRVELAAQASATYGIQSTDVLAEYVIAMPSDRVFAASTVNASDVIRADDAKLQSLFKDKVVVVGDEFEGQDLHEYVGGRKLFGLQVQAQAIDALLNDRTIRRPPMCQFAGMLLSSQVPVELALAVVGGIAAVYLGKRVWWCGLFMGVALLVVCSAILFYRQSGIVYSPWLALLGLLTSYELGRIPRSLSSRMI
jgi:CHASE2 domain-containing sensor protein